MARSRNNTLYIPIIAVIFCMAGCGATHQQEREKATARWQRVRTDTARQMAQQQLEKGQMEQARSTLDGALRSNPNDALLHLLMARVLFEQQDMNGAQTEVTAAQRLAPDLPEIDYWQGVLAQASGQWQEALAAYQVAYNKMTSSPDYLCAVLEVQIVLGRHREASDLACSRFHDFPRDARLRILAGSAMLMQNDLPQAEILYSQAASLDPMSQEVKERLAQILCQAGKFHAAAALLQSLLAAQSTGRSDLQQLLGTCLLRSGRYDAAVKIYESCVADRPQETSLRLRLQEARLLCGQIVPAQQGLNELLEQYPRQPHAWELLGHAYVLQGQRPQAQQAYKHAIQCGANADVLQSFIQALDAQTVTIATAPAARAMAAMDVRNVQTTVPGTGNESKR